MGWTLTSLLHNVARNWIHRGRDILVTVLSFLVFASLGLLDHLLCPVFAFLDSVFSGDSPPPCCCRPPPEICAPGHGDKACDGESPLAASATAIDSKVLALESETLWSAGRGSDCADDFHPGFRFRQPHSRQSAWSRRGYWSDCVCDVCNSWRLGDQHLHVHIEGLASSPEKNVVFLHGFCSSSSFWVDTVFPELSKSVGSSYRLFAVDLLGFGNSPKPTHCSYTILDHVAMIQCSIVDRYGVHKFHVVGHSMGCVIALALAARHPEACDSVTLMSPPYFPPDNGGVTGASAHFLRQVAPRKMWPPLTFGTSVMSWYEHVGRLMCLLLCKNHRLWEPLLLLCLPKMLGHPIPRSFITDFTKHTHLSAWLAFHNTLCGGAQVFDRCMGSLAQARVKVWVIYGGSDPVCPPKCSLDLKRSFPNTQLLLVPGANHVTCVLGREHALAADLQRIILNSG